MSCRRFANHGALTKHHHEIEGINSRMDGIQASLLSAKLSHLNDWTQRRREIAAKYDQLLYGLGDLELPAVRGDAFHVYHLYVVQTDKRDALREFLSECGVQSQIHYPQALPMMAAYKRLGHKASQFPRAVRNSRRILSLPVYAEMTDDMIEFVADRIDAFFRQ
jgi:dTDP-4-amino-4,6-dideoxygalactose transaminase